MKIAYISAYFHPVTGGAENHMYYIAKELVKKGHDVEVYVSDSDRKGRIEKKEEVIDGIKVKRFKTWFKISLSGMFFPGVFRAVKKSDADLISVHGFRHPFSFVPFFTKKPCIVTLHWAHYYGLRAKWLDFFVKLFDRFFGRLLLKKYKKVLAVSGTEIDWIKSFNVPESKIELTPNGIPKEYLKKANGIKFRKKWGIKENELMILCLSRLHKSKGIDQVIKIAKYFPNVKFVIVGVDGGFRNELENLVKSLKLKNVIFTGKVSEEEKLEAYRAADIFIHPSHYEAFGIIVLEAFSQETAVITSDNGGLPWVVGDAGLIFKDYDLDDLRRKIEKLVKNKNLRTKLAKKGRKRVEQFIWDKIIDGVEKVYERVLRENIRK